jgi:hypothetical protein
MTCISTDIYDEISNNVFLNPAVLMLPLTSSAWVLFGRSDGLPRTYPDILSKRGGRADI